MVIYLPTLHLRTLGNEIELEFGNVDFFGDGKTGEPGKNPLGARREPTTNSTVPKYEAGSANRTQATWWEASALTSAPPLLPTCSCLFFDVLNYILDFRCELEVLIGLTRGGEGRGSVASF